MGAPKKIDVFKASLSEADLALEDQASRLRIQRYLECGADIAVGAEQAWREDIGLEPVDLS